MRRRVTTTHEKTPTLTARGAAAALAFVVATTGVAAAGSADSAHSSTARASAATSSGPRLIAYAVRESGVTVTCRSRVERLVGSPRSFNRFVGDLAHDLAQDTTCDAFHGVTVETVRTDGYALGGVNDCGGYAALWAEVDGAWREISGTRDTWRCGLLKKYVVPSDVAGRTCYTHASKQPRTKHYSQA